MQGGFREMRLIRLLKSASVAFLSSIFLREVKLERNRDVLISEPALKPSQPWVQQKKKKKHQSEVVGKEEGHRSTGLYPSVSYILRTPGQCIMVTYTRAEKTKEE
jgi:hypothetical protein